MFQCFFLKLVEPLQYVCSGLSVCLFVFNSVRFPSLFGDCFCPDGPDMFLRRTLLLDQGMVRTPYLLLFPLSLSPWKASRFSSRSPIQPVLCLRCSLLLNLLLCAWFSLFHPFIFSSFYCLLSPPMFSPFVASCSCFKTATSFWILLDLPNSFFSKNKTKVSVSRKSSFSNVWSSLGYSSLALVLHYFS